MNILFIITYIFWFLSEIVLSISLRSNKTDKQHKDKGSLSFIWILILGSIFAAVYISIRYYMPLSENNRIRYIGIAVVLLGVLLRFMAVFSLGKFFTVNVTIRKNHKIKTDDLYKYIRHPSYAASLLSFTGFGISLNNWYSLFLMLTLITIAFLYRIKVEEKALIEFFGSDYLNYMNKTKKILPFIY